LYNFAASFIALSDGVMVALQILVLPVQVRIPVGQPDKTIKFSKPPEINEIQAVLFFSIP
jgi:hypothetical protein